MEWLWKLIAGKFAIEFYPETGRYYPTYRGSYLKRDYFTWIVETRHLLTYACFGTTEAEADQISALFKEQRLKENVKVIPR